MRFLAGLASLLALALIAPGAQAATEVRHYDALLAQYINAGSPPTGINGRLGLDVVFKNKKGSPNKFTPRSLALIELENVALSCNNPPMLSQAVISGTVQSTIKLRVTSQPAGRKPKANRYSYSYASAFPALPGTSGVTGSFNGRFYKSGGKGPVIASGKFRIDHLDFEGSGPQNCVTALGEQGWSAPKGPETFASGPAAASR